MELGAGQRGPFGSSREGGSATGPLRRGWRLLWVRWMFAQHVCRFQSPYRLRRDDPNNFKVGVSRSTCRIVSKCEIARRWSTLNAGVPNSATNRHVHNFVALKLWTLSFVSTTIIVLSILSYLIMTHIFKVSLVQLGFIFRLWISFRRRSLEHHLAI